MSAEFLTKVDTEGLRTKLVNNPELFDRYAYRKDKYVHSQMSDIWCRYNHPGNLGPTFNDEHSSVWYPVIHQIPEVLPICARLMAIAIGERLGGVLITKLAPGGRIEPHTDGGWHAGYYSKFYVPVQNGPGSRFCWQDTVIEPANGEVYEFRNDIPHWVENDSEIDRIAMIVCIRKFRDSFLSTSKDPSFTQVQK